MYGGVTLADVTSRKHCFVWSTPTFLERMRGYQKSNVKGRGPEWGVNETIKFAEEKFSSVRTPVTCFVLPEIALCTSFSSSPSFFFSNVPLRRLPFPRVLWVGSKRASFSPLSLLLPPPKGYTLQNGSNIVIDAFYDL